MTDLQLWRESIGEDLKRAGDELGSETWWSKATDEERKERVKQAIVRGVMW